MNIVELSKQKQIDKAIVDIVRNINEHIIMDFGDQRTEKDIIENAEESMTEGVTLKKFEEKLVAVRGFIDREIVFLSNAIEKHKNLSKEINVAVRYLIALERELATYTKAITAAASILPEQMPESEKVKLINAQYTICEKAYHNLLEEDKKTLSELEKVGQSMA